MKKIRALPIMLISIFFLYAFPVLGMDEHHTYEFGDGHWIYFGPAQTVEWTTVRRLPLKRSLQQSIRGDALRHYELPRFEMAESGQILTFSGENEVQSIKKESVRTVRKPLAPKESNGEVFELPESGIVILFPNENLPPSMAESVVARQGDGPS